MRKVLYLLIIPVILAGCAKVKEVEVPQGQNGLHEVVFHAGWDPETRTMLQEDGSVWWEPGDEAGLFFQLWTENEEEGWYQTPRVKLVSTNDEEAPKADFVANLDELFLHFGIQSLDGISTFYAIYPYSDRNYFISSNDGSLFLNYSIPTIQMAVVGSFDRNAFVSYAETQDDKLYFRNLCGGVKFSVSQAGIKEVTFRYSSGDKMSGDFGLRYKHADGTIGFPPIWGGESDEVIVRAPDDSYFEVGKYYYAVMCPSENESPLIVTYKKDDSKATYITSGPTTIKRSVFKRLYDKDKDLTFVPRKDEAVMMSILPDYLWYDASDEIKALTEVYFHPSSDHVTDENLGTEDGPVYFELDGTVVHYYTPKESFNIKNVSARMFAYWSSLSKVDLTGVDASEATDLSYFFAGTNLTSLDLSHFDTSNATNMEYMFGESKYLESLDLSSFNTEHVTDMSHMFYMCRNLRELNLGSFDTSHCIDMGWMFCYCGSLQKLDLAGFDVSAVNDASYMSYLFATHRKHCIVRASDATKGLMLAGEAMMPVASEVYYVTWIDPGEEFPPFDDPFADLYKSADYSKDMTYSTIQTATKGGGIDIVIMGDAYSDRLINDGTYDRDLINAIENIFMEEPLHSLREYFNVYIVYAVSENETVAGVTKFDVIYDFVTNLVTGNETVVDEYEKAIWPNLGFEIATGRHAPFPIVIANVQTHAGTCEFWNSGTTIVYSPLGIDEEDFHAIICHEFGHAIGKLADEYNQNGLTFNAFEEFNKATSDGFWPNVDITNNPNLVKWSHFINDERYSNQGLGVFEGGFEKYSYGIWRPTENSIMNSAITGFNAPCREAVYKRVHELAEDNFVYDYETFVAFDQNARAEAARVNRMPRMTPERILPHLPPPVFIQGADNPHGASTTLHR